MEILLTVLWLLSLFVSVKFFFALVNMWYPITFSEYNTTAWSMLAFAIILPPVFLIVMIAAVAFSID